MVYSRRASAMNVEKNTKCIVQSKYGMGECELWAGEMRDESSPLLSSSINEEYWSAPGGLVATAAVLIITSILFGALDILSVALWLAFHCTFYGDFGYSRRFFILWILCGNLLSASLAIVNLLKQNVLKLDTTIVFVLLLQLVDTIFLFFCSKSLQGAVAGLS